MDLPQPQVAASLRGWDMFAGVFFIGLPLGIISQGREPRYWLVQLAAQAVWYVVLGRFALRGGRRACERAYIAGAGLLIIWGSGSTGWLLWVQLLILPMVWWMFLPDRPRAIAWSVYIVAANVVGVIGCIIWSVGRNWSLLNRVLNVIVAPFILLVLCIAMVMWLDRSFHWGRNRVAIADELQASQKHALAMEREAAAAEERLRLSREIHDTIAQGIAGVRLLAEQARRQAAELDDGSAGAHALGETLASISAAASDVFTETRDLIASSGRVLPGPTVTSSVQRITDRFTQDTGTPVALAVAELPLDRDAAVVLVRCAQEGLANVRKHARATRVWLTLEQEGDTAVLTLTDDGVGMAPGTTHGYGLTGMTARVADAGGTLMIEPSGPGFGVRLTVRLPMGQSSTVRRRIEARADAVRRRVRGAAKPTSADRAGRVGTPADEASAGRWTAVGMPEDQAECGPGGTPPAT